MVAGFTDHPKLQEKTIQTKNREGAKSWETFLFGQLQIYYKKQKPLTLLLKDLATRRKKKLIIKILEKNLAA